MARKTRKPTNALDVLPPLDAKAGSTFIAGGHARIVAETAEQLRGLAKFFLEDTENLTMAGIPRAITSGAMRQQAEYLDEIAREIRAGVSAGQTAQKGA